MMGRVAPKLSADYGQCPCGGTYEQRNVEVAMNVAGERLIVPDVPQGECPVCGSRVYRAATLEAIEDVMRGRRPRVVV
jgi:YgiT-type zinc finger domain-containing protein